jgi:23S rRNA-/tRNA-specific pseudouridylate synthase
MMLDRYHDRLLDARLPTRPRPHAALGSSARRRYPRATVSTFAIVARTDGWIAVSKPVGIATIPERDPEVPSLQRSLERELGLELFVVHRLDKEVSGLVLFALDAATHRALSLAFEHREVKKTYLAVVLGVPAWSELSATQKIHAFGSGRMGVDERRGKASTTELTVLARGAAHALVEARPVTGRRHQIRVHLYASGHPIAGDTRYGDRAAQSVYPRLLLHARRLVLPSSLGGHVLEVPLGPDFVAELDRLVGPGLSVS